MFTRLYSLGGRTAARRQESGVLVVGFVPVFGPLQMIDLIGHDTLRDISDALYPELAADRTASRTIEEHVADGRLGVKSGRGFYDDNDQRVAELTSKLYQVAGQLAAE